MLLVITSHRVKNPGIFLLHGRAELSWAHSWGQQVPELSAPSWGGGTLGVRTVFPHAVNSASPGSSAPCWGSQCRCVTRNTWEIHVNATGNISLLSLHPQSQQNGEGTGAASGKSCATETTILNLVNNEIKSTNTVTSNLGSRNPPVLAQGISKRKYPFHCSLWGASLYSARVHPPCSAASPSEILGTQGSDQGSTQTG